MSASASRLHGAAPHRRAVDPKGRRDRPRALRHGQRAGDPWTELLDRQVGDLDALLAPRCTTARSAASTIAATLTCRSCAARPMRASPIRNVMRMCSGVAWNDEDDAPPEPEPAAGPGEPAAGRPPGPPVHACRAPAARRRFQLLDRRELLAGRAGRGLPRAGRWPTTAPKTIWGLPAWKPTGIGRSKPRAAMSWAGPASARACATLAASANWCWRTAKRSVVVGSCRPAGATSPASPTAHPPASVGSCPAPLGYGYQWWVLPHGPTGIHAGAFVAIGAFGQYIYVNPAEQVVAAIQSAWRQHHDSDAELETFKLLEPCCKRAPTGPIGPGAWIMQQTVFKIRLFPFGLKLACLKNLELKETTLQSASTARAVVNKAGSHTLTVVPLPSSLSISNCPRWRLTMCLTIASPSPVPPTARERPLSAR